MTARPKEHVSNARITVQLLGSGYAAVCLVDVRPEGAVNSYTDVQQTGAGRYRTYEEAAIEARQWAEAEGLQFNDRTSA